MPATDRDLEEALIAAQEISARPISKLDGPTEVVFEDGAAIILDASGAALAWMPEDRFHAIWRAHKKKVGA